jgi:hypothetical protein
MFYKEPLMKNTIVFHVNFIWYTNSNLYSIRGPCKIQFWRVPIKKSQVVNDKPIIYSWIRVQLSMVYWPCKNQTPYIKWLHLYSSCNSSKVVRDSSLVSGIHLFFVVQKITKSCIVIQLYMIGLSFTCDGQ